jgi:hypothetical protein
MEAAHPELATVLKGSHKTLVLQLYMRLNCIFFTAGCIQAFRAWH